MDWCIDPAVVGWRPALERDVAAHLSRRAFDGAAVEAAMLELGALLDRVLSKGGPPHRVTLLWGDDGAGSLHLRLLDGASGGAALPGIAIGHGVSACPWGHGVLPPSSAAEPSVTSLGLVRPAEQPLDADVGSTRLPSGRERFLTALAAMGPRVQGLGPEAASAFAGAAASHQAEDEHRRAHGTDGPLDARGVAEAFVAFQRTIGGDFAVEEASEREAIVTNHTCPFGPAVVGAPHLCRLTSAMLGAMAAKNAGEAAVRLDERLAVGDRRCRLALRLGAGTGAGTGAHRYRWPPAGVEAAAAPGTGTDPAPGSSAEPPPGTGGAGGAGVASGASVASGAGGAGGAAGATPSVALALELPHDRAAVALARHVTREALAAIDVAGDVVDDIVLALSEACANVLRHVTPSSYEVRVLVRDHRCEVRVADRGQGLDVEAVRRRRPAPEAERGRGLAIMEGVMDRVEVLSEPGRGTRVTLVKHLAFTPGSEAAALLRHATPQA